MNDIFTYQWLLSLIVGGLWITIVTVLVERFGPKIGGLIAGIPSTAALTLIFIALTQSPSDAVNATPALILSTGFLQLFFIGYLIGTRRSFLMGLFLGLIGWLTTSFYTIVSDIKSFYASVVMWVIFSIVGILFSKFFITTKEAKPVSIKYSSSQLISRALLGGFIISFAVLMSKVSGSVWGGVMGTFPALTISTFLIIVKTGGLNYTRILAKTLQISFAINLAIYAFAVKLTYLSFGILLGTIAAFSLTILSAMMIKKYLL